MNGDLAATELRKTPVNMDKHKGMLMLSLKEMYVAKILN